MKVTIQLEECEVIVEGDYIPAEYGERDAEGQKLEPDYSLDTGRMFDVREATL